MPMSNQRWNAFSQAGGGTPNKPRPGDAIDRRGDGDQGQHGRGRERNAEDRRRAQ